MSFSKNIIGKGFIAKNLSKISREIIQSKIIIYAAGISNSNTESRKDLVREINSFNKFSKINKRKKILFISTADVTNNLKNRSKYVKNKIKIEKSIKKNFKNFIIVRIPQIIGKSKNKNTLINFFYNKIKSRKTIKLLLNVDRNLLDIDDIIKMIKVIIMNNKINKKVITLSNKYFIQPIDIIRIFEKTLKISAKYNFKKTKKQNWNLHFKKNIKYFSNAKIKFDKYYFSKTIKKYY
tara:strand:- start:176 stop:886 length:711 start_codon:yes stop_codon:yes gene_type:complete